MDLIYVCDCGNQVRITEADRLAVCPHCGLPSRVLSGIAEEVVANRNGEKISYDLIIAGQKITLRLNPANLAAQTMLTVVWNQGSIAGVSDDSRKLWFPAERQSSASLWPLWILAAPVMAVAGWALYNSTWWVVAGVSLLLLLSLLVPAERDVELPWES